MEPDIVLSDGLQGQKLFQLGTEFRVNMFNVDG